MEKYTSVREEAIAEGRKSERQKFLRYLEKLLDDLNRIKIEAQSEDEFMSEIKKLYEKIQDDYENGIY